MKAKVAPTPIYLYRPGDILLESDREEAAGLYIDVTAGGEMIVAHTPGAGSLNILGGGGGDKEAEAKGLLDIIKPKKDDLPALTKTLQVLKFSPQNVIDYHEILGSMINFASGVFWAAGAIGTVKDLYEKLFVKKIDENAMRIAHISQRVDQIYGYLAQQEKRGLHTQAANWRVKLNSVRNAINNARISRSPSNLDALEDLKPVLDDNLQLMLDPGSGKIAFLRATYGYTHGSHWIDACTPPFMATAGGAPLTYRNPADELQAEIWDPGHYLDILLSGLSDRLLLLATTEPAYRSTFYDMEQVENLMTSLTTFINHWRASLFVANPAAGLNGGGPMQHPMVSVPFGIAVGAVDPVTGIAFFDPYWDEFPMLSIWNGSLAAKGSPDERRAKHPVQTLADALALQKRLIEGTIKASGIPRLVEFRTRLQDILTRYSVGSDFVDLPNAKFKLIQMNGPAAQTEKVDLGFYGNYSKNPGKKYEGQRFTQVTEKSFRFAMALRTDRSLVQLGYRMQIGSHNIPLIKYSVAPGEGTAPRFPTQPISAEIRSEDWSVYDVHQSVVFSQHDEDQFEGATPSLPWSPYIYGYQVIPPERLFLNERPGRISLKVEVTFEADLNSPAQPFVGYATVVIRNLDPSRNTGGIILPVSVYEERVVDKYGKTEEFLADHMTVHIVPSFLVLGPQYFEDRREGHEQVDVIFGGIAQKYAISEQFKIPGGAEWMVRRRAAEEVLQVAAIERFVREEPDAAAELIGRFDRSPVRRTMLAHRVQTVGVAGLATIGDGQDSTSPRGSHRVAVDPPGSVHDPAPQHGAL